MNGTVVSNILYLLFFALNAYFLNYIMKLEKSCECSMDWRRDYIKYYIIIQMFVYVLMALGIYYRLHYSVPVLFGVFGLICTGFVFFYIRKLKEIKCACSETTARTVMEYLNYLNIAIYFFSIVSILFIGNVFIGNVIRSQYNYNFKNVKSSK